MDWITFIKWNGVLYASYYGVNLLVDYLQTKREISPNSSYTEYQLKDLGIEETKVIKSADFAEVNKETATGKKQTSEKATREIPERDVQFNAPIERQGIPFDQFIKFAGKSGNEIFQPTI